MKISTKLSLRKIINNKKQLLSMGILVIVASMFFVTLFSFKNSYEEQAEYFFEEHSYADVTLTGSFSNEDINTLLSMDNVKQVEGRFVQEYNEDNFSARLISVTEKLNTPYVIEGCLPTSKDEIAIMNQFYEVNDYKIADTITIDSRNFTIVGVVNSPEYIYYVKNALTVFTDPQNFLIGFVGSNHFEEYNQIIFTQDSKISEEVLKEKISFDMLSKRESQMNYKMYTNDMEEFATFAYIFPTIFWIMSFCIIYIILRRTITKEHKHIGTIQAIGQNKRSIMKIYIFQCVLLGLFSSFVGCLLSIPMGNVVIYAFKGVIEIPNLYVSIYPMYWIFSITVSMLGCLLFGVISIMGTLNNYPHDSMKLKTKKVKNSLKIKDKNRVWKRMSFNTRYAITTTLRNKSNFFVMIFGLSASTALLIFSLGFNDSFNQLTPKYYENFASYDLIASVPATPFEQDILTYEDEFLSQDKAFKKIVTIDDEEFSFTIFEDKVNSLALSEESLKKGAIIPEYYADKWKVSVGDLIEVDSKKMEVSEIVPLGLGLSIFTSYEYASEIFENFPSIYNTVYIQSDNPENIQEKFRDSKITFSTTAEDRASFESRLETFRFMIIMLVLFGAILGLTVIICMNIMNLTSREFEYMFMSIMGYSKGRILLAIFKETIVQLIIALPLGLFAGYHLINLIRDEFSQNNLVLYTEVVMSSYIIVIILVIIMSMSRLISSNRHINTLDIVEGLKVQDD